MTDKGRHLVEELFHSGSFRRRAIIAGSLVPVADALFFDRGAGGYSASWPAPPPRSPAAAARLPDADPPAGPV